MMEGTMKDASDSLIWSGVKASRRNGMVMMMMHSTAFWEIRHDGSSRGIYTWVRRMGCMGWDGMGYPWRVCLL